MMRAWHVDLLRFPSTDLTPGKLRPVLLIAPSPGSYGDWLVCMISTQLRQALEGFDEVIDQNADDFAPSGLKVASVVRLSRLAVVSIDSLVGAIGEISPVRLEGLRATLVRWIWGP